MAALRRVRLSGNRFGDSSEPFVSLNPAFVQRIDLKERCKAIDQVPSRLPPSERESHYRNLTWGLMPFTLEVLDRTAAAFGIESRFPFWDKRLVEFCLASYLRSRKCMAVGRGSSYACPRGHSSC
jgi:asparagine synthase (glutamine-hydrolysing)